MEFSVRTLGRKQHRIFTAIISDRFTSLHTQINKMIILPGQYLSSLQANV